MKMHMRHKVVIERRVYDFSECRRMVAIFNNTNRAYITDDKTKVTCKTCQKIFQKEN